MGARSGASGVSGPWPMGAKMRLSTTISQALGSLPDRDFLGVWHRSYGSGVIRPSGLQGQAEHETCVPINHAVTSFKKREV